MINKPPPHNRDYNRDPNIKALKRRGFFNPQLPPNKLKADWKLGPCLGWVLSFAQNPPKKIKIKKKKKKKKVFRV